MEESTTDHQFAAWLHEGQAESELGRESTRGRGLSPPHEDGARSDGPIEPELQSSIIGRHQSLTQATGVLLQVQPVRQVQQLTQLNAADRGQMTPLIHTECTKRKGAHLRGLEALASLCGQEMRSS